MQTKRILFINFGGLGDEILSLYLEDIDFFNELEQLKNVNVDIFDDFIEYFKKSYKIKCFCKKS